MTPAFWCIFCEKRLVHPDSHQRLVCYGCGMTRVFPAED